MRLAHLHLPSTTPFARKRSKHAQTISPKRQPLPHLIQQSSPSPQIQFTQPAAATSHPQIRHAANPPDLKNLSLPSALEPIRSILSLGPDGQPPRAEYHPTLRGGQTTYHGPGQMVAYTILDLKRLGLTPRCHIRVLENSVIDLLKRYGVNGFVTEDPGVWVKKNSGNTDSAARKITAVGVHLRRNISSFGVGLNVTQEPMWFFKQIVACGLEGKEATSLEGVGVTGVSVDEVAQGFVEGFVSRVNRDFACGEGASGEKIEEVYMVNEEDLLREVNY
ncbi:Octanoyltransferase [Penicillium waksmanii]|uniref:Octanoyltransferase n=1 Tax=Penicillium waksmanii TaxID=69791 RepID=UPI0025482D9F|nr:Octanoyltransferase [Penicillium waksmanii]KAJ5965656.1 Octanoyltransferase [Penicillium waksmanii]